MYIDSTNETKLSKSLPNGGSETITVSKADNGYIVNYEKCYYEGEGENKKYKSDKKTVITKDNPLDKDPVEDTLNAVQSLFNDTASAEGKIIIPD